MTKTIIVSNRLPIEFNISADEIDIKPSVGGLATGLKSVHAEGDSLWVGWSGLTEEQIRPSAKNKVASTAMLHRCVTVPLNEKDVKDFYLGFSNRALWPLFHYFMVYTEYDPKQWKAYQKANEKFADVVLQHANEGDQIWVHDYQLLLLPGMLRERNPSLSIGFFLHIPFPAFEVFRTCPWRTELLEGILGADLIGFHTYGYVQNFLNSVKNLGGFPVKFNEIQVDARMVKVDSFPMGIDYKSFREAALEHLMRKEHSEFTVSLLEHSIKYPDSKLVLSIDRMDYTKGIPQRIKTFEHFLEKYPEYKEKVRFIMLSVPSRTNVPQYGKLKKETDELVGRINGKFGSIDWTPIWYFYRSMPFEDLIDLYSFSHVALITPLRDGMNLVAKEYVASRVNGDGVVILSEMAGAASEMQEALLINPHNVDQVADALNAALSMDQTEQRQRMALLQERLSRYNVDKWAQDFMKSLEEKKRLTMLPPMCKKMSQPVADEIISAYKNADKKLLLLDYDGTLVEFCNNPDDACPDDALYELLDKINDDSRSEVAIISGRGRESIEKWFGHKAYTLITDHGIWMRRNDAWQKLEEPKIEWKAVVRPVLESFVDRTPGTFIEEKEYSLTWHYRKADSDMSEIRTRELKALLNDLVAENGLSVLEGNKVLEVKNSVVSKGRAATRLISEKHPDMIFAAGDDFTDEFMFDALPESAHTIKVGTAETKARYYVADSSRLKKILEEFTGA